MAMCSARACLGQRAPVEGRGSAKGGLWRPSHGNRRSAATTAMEARPAAQRGPMGEACRTRLGVGEVLEWPSGVEESKERWWL
jgi:hypothetical protein